MEKPKVGLILDSGAFSAANQGEVLDVEKYAQFILANRQHISVPVNLDVVAYSTSDIEGAQECAEKSYRNFLYLKDKGIDSMPVFHVNEPMRYLDYMIENADWIGLASSMGTPTITNAWHQLMWDYVTDDNGYPIRKFHAFGNTVPKVLLTYPWYSSDSTTWVMAGGMAARTFLNDRAVQFRPRMAKDFLFISDKDSGIKKDTWEKVFRENGLDPEKCINGKMRESDLMLIRAYMNCAYFMKLQERTRSVTKYLGPKTLVGLEKKYKNGFPAVEPAKIHFAFTASTATRALAVFAHLGVQNLLISNYYITEKIWNEMIVPYLYDPVGVCLGNPKIRKEYEFLASYKLNSVEVAS